MLPKQPNFQRDEPATSPALSRRRDHMLHGDHAQLREPRLIPQPDDDDVAVPEADAFGDDDFDPEIPPPPVAAGDFETDAEQEPQERGARGLRLWPVAAGAAVLVLLGGTTWIVYDAVVADTGSGVVPYITAEPGPEKIRPQDAGGMDVPNQDISVYNELTGSPEAPEAEVLLPPPEAPLSPPAPAEESAAIESAEIPSVPAPLPEADPTAASSDEHAGAATAAPDDPPSPAASAAADTEPAAGEEPVQAAVAAGAFRIQLAAVKSQDAARLGWQKMTKAYPDILGPLTLNVVKVDRASGALYRLQAGPFADRGTAEAACGKLKQKRQDCLVVAP
jgi:hypothetical protein